MKLYIIPRHTTANKIVETPIIQFLFCVFLFFIVPVIVNKRARGIVSIKNKYKSFPKLPSINSKEKIEKRISPIKSTTKNKIVKPKTVRRNMFAIVIIKLQLTVKHL